MFAMFAILSRSGRRPLKTALASGLLLVPLFATAQVKPAASHTPAATETLYRAGYDAYSRGDLITAQAQFTKLVALTPGNPVGHAALGAVLLARGQAGAALQQLQQAQKLDPANAATRAGIGSAWAALGDQPKARAAFAEAVQAGLVLSPDESRAYAAAIAEGGDVAGARRILESALQPRQDTKEALEPAQIAILEDALGSAIAQQGEFDLAANHFEKAVAADQNLASAHAHLGSAALGLHQPERAIAALERAVSLAPAEVAYAIELGRAYTEEGQDERAIHVLRGAVALAESSPTSGATGPHAARNLSRAATPAHQEQAERTPQLRLYREASYALALALQAGGKPLEALPLLAAHAAQAPSDSSAQTNYALCLVQTGDAKKAITIYEKALAAGPDTATLREDFGVAYLQQSDLDHALEQFKAGLALAPENPHLHYDLGLAWKLKDDLKAAIPEFERAETIDPTLPDPPYTLGVIRMQQGDFTAAAAQLEQAVALRPGNDAAWSVLGNVYKENGEPAKAVEALRRAIALAPGQPSTHITLATLLAQQGDRAAATEERRQAAELSRAAVSQQRASFHLRSGRALLAEGKLKEAEAQLRVAVEADPHDPAAHQALADTLQQGGSQAEAAVEREQAQRQGAAVKPGGEGGPAPAPH